MPGANEENVLRKMWTGIQPAPKALENGTVLAALTLRVCKSAEL